MMIFVNLILCFMAVASPAWGETPWAKIKQTVIQADLEPNRKAQKKLAQSALAMAENCLEARPNEIGCLYYKAQALGLSNQGFFGYTKRVRQMIKDWEKVMQIDPTFDYGGPYRMIAEIHMELPKNFGPKDLRQDLNKAVDYLRKAVAISNYPTNGFDLSEALIQLGKEEESQKILHNTRTILPRWRANPYYPSWIQVSDPYPHHPSGGVRHLK